MPSGGISWRQQTCRPKHWHRLLSLLPCVREGIPCFAGCGRTWRKIENQKVHSREKIRKMRTVHLGFRSSPSRDTIVVVESVSKHGHPGLGGTSPGDTSAELPHVGHRDEILDGLIGRNKLVQQDGNHGPFVNQNTIRQELLETVQGRISFFHP